MGDQADAPPVSVEEFAACLDDLNVRGAFAIAVSGGRDSMALARLAAVFAARKKVRVLALTVDHGLRPESAQEAEQAAAWCKAAGLTHCILTWEGAKPSSGIQEAARHARYKLLAQAVEEAGLATLLTAHSADDQAETVFMRLARGAGAAGLSGMSATRLIAAGPGAPIRLVRPFLTAPRNRLTAAVEGFRQPYIDDPGNDDPAFERIRARALLAALEQQSILTRD
ncbi:MAG: tRNA lysidine(34) synthetase TilS, partial [Hyphococcus sp.]